MVPATVLRFTTAYVHGRSLVAVEGEVDIATAAELRTYLCDAVDANSGNASRVVMVDLSEVTFMDASGLTALIRAEGHACGLGAHLHLTVLPPCITRLLRIARLDRHFDLCPVEGGDLLPTDLRSAAARQRARQPVRGEVVEQEAAPADRQRHVSVIAGSGVG